MPKAFVEKSLDLGIYTTQYGKSDRFIFIDKPYCTHCGKPDSSFLWKNRKTHEEIRKCLMIRY
jgi:hypothetical protein